MHVFSRQEILWLIELIDMIKEKPVENITPTVFSESKQIPVEEIYVFVNQMVERGMFEYAKDNETLMVLEAGWTIYEAEKPFENEIRRCL